MIQVVPKMTGLPEVEATQVSVDVMTFNTESPTANTYYRVCDVDGKTLEQGNYLCSLVAATPFNTVMTSVEDQVLAYLTLVRE
jgi:hypothetical protein